MMRRPSGFERGLILLKLYYSQYLRWEYTLNRLSDVCVCAFLSATELKFRADYNSTPCGVVVVVVVVVVGVRVHFKKWITF